MSDNQTNNVWPEIGEEVSEGLLPASHEEASQNYVTLRELYFRLAGIIDHGGGIRLSDINEDVSDDLRAVLATGRVDAYVYSREDELYKIPLCYWRSFDAYRPLRGEGFNASPQMGMNAYKLNRQYVLLGRQQVNEQWPDGVTLAVKHTDAERRAWMIACEINNADKAYAEYRNDPHYDGTKQPEFRAEFSALRGNGRGRPRKN